MSHQIESIVKRFGANSNEKKAGCKKPAQNLKPMIMIILS